MIIRVDTNLPYHSGMEVPDSGISSIRFIQAYYNRNLREIVNTVYSIPTEMLKPEAMCNTLCSLKLYVHKGNDNVLLRFWMFFQSMTT